MFHLPNRDQSQFMLTQSAIVPKIWEKFFATLKSQTKANKIVHSVCCRLSVEIRIIGTFLFVINCFQRVS